MSDNPHTSDKWKGDKGSFWSDNADAMDEMLSSYGPLLQEIAKVSDGEHVLDVGCGAGRTTLDAAMHVGSTGSALGVDVSDALLSVAKKRASQTGSVAEFEQADASVWKTANKKDVFISRFGVMFFDDPTSAFSNIRSSMAKDGRLAFLCWRGKEYSPMFGLVVNVAASFLKAKLPEPENGTLGPFAFSDPDRLRGILQNAGWKNINIEYVDPKIRFAGTDTTDLADQLIRLSPAESALKEEGVDINLVRTKVIEDLKSHMNSDGNLEFTGGVWAVTANA